MISVMETQDYESTPDAQISQSESRVPADDGGTAASDDIPDGFEEKEKITSGFDIEGSLKIQEPVFELNGKGDLEEEKEEIRVGFDIEGSLNLNLKIEEPVIEIESNFKKSSTVETDKIRARFDLGKTEPCQLPIETKITTTTTVCSEYDSMLSMFDEFAATGKIGGVVKSSSFDNGDMVWAKVKSHPWWPGQIFSESFASNSVRTSKRVGSVLVAFFGDSSYGWFVKDELLPFDANFDEKSKQTNTKSFVNAVEEAIYEASKRSALGLACRCRNSNSFRSTDVEGYLAVDMSDYDPGAVYAVKQIEKARQNFKPKDMVDFIKRLAGLPRGSKHEGLDFFKKKATVLAYRKTVFEEFDYPYTQAFGGESRNRPIEKEQEAATINAPPSGELVIAEASSKTKISALKPKIKKPKEQTEKVKYLLQLSDETDGSISLTIDESTFPAPSENAEGTLVNLHTQPPALPKTAKGTLVNLHTQPPAQPKIVKGTLVNLHTQPPAQPKNAKGTLVNLHTPPPAQLKNAEGTLVNLQTQPPAQPNNAEGTSVNWQTQPPAQPKNAEGTSVNLNTQPPAQPKNDEGTSVNLQGQPPAQPKNAEGTFSNLHPEPPAQSKNAEGSLLSSHTQPPAQPENTEGTSVNVHAQPPAESKNAEGSLLSSHTQPPAQPENAEGTSVNLHSQPPAESKNAEGTFVNAHTQPPAQPKNAEGTSVNVHTQPPAQSKNAEGTSVNVHTQPPAQPRIAEGTSLNVHTQPPAQPRNAEGSLVNLHTQRPAQPKNAEGTSVNLHTQPPAQPKNADGILVNLRAQPPSNLLVESLLIEESSGTNTATADLKGTVSKSTVETKKVKVQKRPSAEIIGEKPPVKKKRSKIVQMVQNLPGENIQATDGDKVKRRKMGPRFPRLLNDLHALAVNPMQHIQKSKGKVAVVRKVFLKFRSIVYQKSLPTSTPEIDRNESRPKESASLPKDSAYLPKDSASLPKDSSSLKPAKPLRISDNQTKVLLKRGPSDRQEEKRVAKKKKFDDVKSLVSDKKNAVTQRPVKHEPPKRPAKREPPVRVPNPTSLVLKFPQNGHLPSPYELRARFVRFGPLDHDQIRIFWKTSTCRVVFQYKSDAESAYRFADDSPSLFGNTGVRCFLREMESDDPEPSDAPAAPTLAPLPPPPPVVEYPAGVQIKSILKRSNDDSGINGGSGGARGSARVKFELGGEEIRKNNTSSSYNDGGSSSTYSQTMDYNSRNFQNFAPSNFANPSSQYSRPHQQNNSHYNEALLPRNDQNFSAPVNIPTAPPQVDVSQQMIALLTQCNDVVNRVTRFLGYVPYHPL